MGLGVGVGVGVVSVVVSVGDNWSSFFALMGQIVANPVAIVADSNADLSASLDDVLCGACVVVDEDG